LPPLSGRTSQTLGVALQRFSTLLVGKNLKIVCFNTEKKLFTRDYLHSQRRCGLGLIMARLPKTSETAVALQFLVMNLKRSLCVLFFIFLRAFLGQLMGRIIL
jgi:hypothetical protein